jgi:hypothetical protein
MNNRLETALIAAVGRRAGDGDRFRRIDGNRSARVIYFLPWNTPLRIARLTGLVALDYLACYEMPASIVSPVPANCVKAVCDILDDVETLVSRRKLERSSLVLVGLSIGNFPATVLANLWRARLCSVCSADRGAHMIWESPAAAAVRSEAEAMGYCSNDFEWAFRGYDPIDNLVGIAPESAFYVSENDPFVPPIRTASLLEAVKLVHPHMRVHSCPRGHLRAMVASRTLQLSMVSGQRRSGWPFRMLEQAQA